MDFWGRSLTELSRFLAGLPSVDLADPFVSERDTSAWRDHAEKMNHLFRQFAVRHARPAFLWARANLGSLRSTRSVFYPFSGPDFMFARLIYPAATTYVLCGLEACSPFPGWNALSEHEAAGGLDGIRTGLAHFLNHSYFITQQMRDNHAGTWLEGALPFLLVLIARMGHTVEGADQVRLEDDGTPVLSPLDQSAPGLRIRLLRKGKLQSLFYFQQDLRDSFCPPDGPFLKFLRRLERPGVFAKCGSYLLHEPNFAHLRDYVFTHCSGVVQDPSSIPYRTFVERGWKVHFHGNYVRTLPVFHRYEQPDLNRAYATPSSGVKPLNFGIGYLTDHRTTSLLIAKPHFEPALIAEL